MRNFVAKHLRKFCKATVEKDRKKEDKKGYVKHKAVLLEKNYGVNIEPLSLTKLEKNYGNRS